MMLTKRIISLMTIIALMVTMLVVPVTYASAYDDELADTSAGNATAYNLPSDIQSGNILQAFSWKLKEVTQYAQEIAEAGYTAVQISPIQKTKNTTNDGAYANDWWSFYQPLDFVIGNELGTKQDLIEMCNVLHSYGVKVVADVVTNHVQESVRTDKVNVLSDTIKSYLRYGQYEKGHTTSDSSRISMTKDNLAGALTDLNTENKSYQNLVISYLNSLADCGVDGYRFDAAKHIGTPDDNANSRSDYWPTITSAIRAKNPNAYIYGEVLSLAGKLPVTAYTKYINVTDYNYGFTVRTAFSSNKNASSLINYGYSGSQKNQNVLWVESHDNFTDGTSAAMFKGKENLLVAAWASVAARKDAPALFYPRPNCETTDAKAGKITYDEYIGAPGSKTTWKHPVVTAVNRFKNEFVGQSENATAASNMFYLQRGTTGMVIVNLNAAKTTVNTSCSMANGTYTDQITGNKFTVSGGKISGSVGSSGVAVVYNPKKAVPIAKVSLNSTQLTADTLNRYTGSTATVKVTLENAQSGTVKVSNLGTQNIPAGGLTFTLNSSIPYGKGVNITVTATNGSQTTTKTFKVYKKNTNETKRVYFDNTVTQWPQVYVYCKKTMDRSSQLAAFPGTKMNLVSGSKNLYYADVPAGTGYVKFNEGKVSVHIGHNVSACGGYCGRTMPYTVIPYGTANDAKNREAGGYQLVGSMLFEKLVWKDYGEYPIASLSSGDVTFPGSTKPTDGPKPTETTKPDPKPTDPISGTMYVGDADRNGKVQISDATAIQRHLARITMFDSDQLKCADVDEDKKVTIEDATWIQRWLARLPSKSGIGSVIENTTETTAVPTEEPEPTIPDVTGDGVTVTLNKSDCFEGGEVYLYAYNMGGGENAPWPGVKMTDNGSAYTLNVDPTLENVKFVGYYGDVVSSQDNVPYPNTIQTNDYPLSSDPVTLETIKITADKTWSECYIHLWSEGDGEPVSTQWPGVKMQGSSGNYYISIPKNSGYMKYKLDDGVVTNEAGPFTVSGQSQGGGNTGDDPISGDYTVYFTNIPNWKTVCAYFWNGDVKNAEWPGQEMEFVETNNMGQKVYKISIPAGKYTNVIFNNKDKAQTVDLDLSGVNNEGFYTTNQTAGKYNCSPYVYGQ